MLSNYERSYRHDERTIVDQTRVPHTLLTIARVKLMAMEFLPARSIEVA